MSEINIKSSTLEKGLELAKDLLGKIAAPAVEELGLMISDNIKHRRLKNQINNLGKVRKIIEDKGMTLKEVNMKVLFPYLEGIAVEEDETLQDMWANLFVNYVDSKSNLKLTVYPLILKQLSSKEVEILLKTSANGMIKNNNEINSEINNLERLGLIKLQDLHTKGNNNFINNLLGSIIIYVLSEFGKDFIEACTLRENKIH